MPKKKRKLDAPKSSFVLTWQVHLFAVAIEAAPLYQAGGQVSLECIMERASLYAVQLGRRDLAELIWARHNVWQAHIVTSAGIANAPVR